MTEIKLRADEARGMADHVKGEAETAKDQINALRSYLDGLGDSFTGKSATAFDTAFNEWKSGADQMMEGLDGLGQFLTTAADMIEQTDSDIASQLG